MIAWYAQTKKSQPQCLAPPTQLELRARVTRLRQLAEVRTAQLNQQRLVTNPAIQNSFRAILKFLAEQIEELQQAIAALIQADPLWRELNQAFRTIKGVADRTVARIMAEMPEIGTLSNKTISKLAGLAPLANDSGKHQGKRAVQGGRATSPRHPVPGGQRGRSLRARLHRLPAAPARRRQATQSRSHRRGPQVARPPQRQSPRGSPTGRALTTEKVS